LLPIDSDGFGCQTEQGLHPLGKASFKGFAIDHREYSSYGVMRGDAIGQLEEGLQPILAGLSKPGDIDPGFSAAKYRADADKDDVQQIMKLCSVYSRVFQAAEYDLDCTFFHDAPLLSL